MRLLSILTALVLLGACASKPPVSLEGTNPKLRPQQALDDFEKTRGERVAWGGVIVATDNLAEHTRIEVLGYPLSSGSARPQTESAAQGRFVIRKAGYLETVDYAPGRIVTVTGTLAEIESGSVGDAAYRYPVVQADELHLWKTEKNTPRTGINFGFGIVITN